MDTDSTHNTCLERGPTARLEEGIPRLWCQVGLEVAREGNQPAPRAEIANRGPHKPGVKKPPRTRGAWGGHGDLMT